MKEITMKDVGGAAEPSRFASIIVSVDLTPDAGNRIRLAGLLANSFSAQLIGVAAEELSVPIHLELPGSGDPTTVQLEQGQAYSDLKKAASLFKQSASMCATLHWAPAFKFERGFATQFLVRHACAADLVVVGQRRSGDDVGRRMYVDPAGVVLACGRPVLMVPPGKDELMGEVAIMAWKDSPQARRAVADSLPLLKRAEKVLLVVVGSDADRQGHEEAQTYLSRHGVASEVLLRRTPPGTVAEELLYVAEQEGADLIVSGAYGHSRTREMVFGGVTRDLMTVARVCCLFSH